MNDINERYILKILPAEGSNPEFAPEKELQEGIEFYGALILLFDEEHELHSGTMLNLSLKNISDGIVISQNDEVINSMRQAFTVAEAYIKAEKIKKDADEHRIKTRLMKVLRGVDPDGEFPEDEIQEFPDEEE